MKRISVLLILVCLGFTAHVNSQPDDGRMLHRFMGKLNLTDVQKKDVEKLVVDMAKQGVDQRAKLAKARIELHELFRADRPDQSAIEKKVDEVANLNTQLQMLRIDSWFSVNKLLTPEQQQTWKKALVFGARLRAGAFDRTWRHPKGHRSEESVPK